MSIDFGLVASRPLLITALVLGFTLLKGGVLRAIGGPLGVPRRERWLFACLLAQGGEFAFVVFGVAGQAKLLPGQWDAILTLVVALSMALTPLALLVHDRVMARADSQAAARPADPIEHHGAPIIIAGFGRFGQIVGRLLFASGLRATVLDHDVDQIELLRKFDFRVFYGDATRLDLLHAAGAAEARLLVVAVDSQEASLQLVDLAREHFPNLAIVARARNVSHWVELRKRGVDVIERETFESALRIGRRALERLGITPYEARERADRFRRHNVGLLEAMLPIFGDEAQQLSAARAGRQQLEKQFAQEKASLDRQTAPWTSAEEDGTQRQREEDEEAEARVPASGA
jgi:glutathione-regulated potassium-efflux system ancillary protein KefC